MSAPQIRDRILRLDRVLASDLLANPANWRRHPPAQQKALRGVLEQVGYADALLARETPEGLLLIDGHLRRDTTPDQEVPVLVLDVTAEEADLLLATLDPLAMMASSDNAALEALLGTLDPTDQTVETHKLLSRLAVSHGFDYGRPETGPDPGPQPPSDALRARWGVQTGQLWLIGDHRLLCGDSTNAGDVARLMNGEQASLLATDPPFRVDYTGGNHPKSMHNQAGITKDKHWGDYVDPESSVEFYRAFLALGLAHCRENVAVYQWHATRRQALVEQAWTAVGLLWHQSIVWVKPRAVLTHGHYLWGHEPCAYGWVEGKPPKQKPPSNETTVWQVAGENDDIHPTQKPVELFTRPITFHTEPGDVCYEPFAGSGTQIVAAERLGRRCYAMEQSPQFVAVILERLKGMGLEPRLAP